MAAASCAAASQDRQGTAFRCPPSGSRAELDNGATIRWLAPAAPGICRTTSRDGERYWAYGVIPSSNLPEARGDADYLRTLFPLVPGKPLVINRSRTIEGATQQFQATGVVQAGIFQSGTIAARPAIVVTLVQVPFYGAGMSFSAGSGAQAVLTIDQATNMLLALKIATNGAGIPGLNNTDWKLVALATP